MGNGNTKWLLILLLPWITSCYSIPKDPTKDFRLSLQSEMPPLVSGALPSFNQGAPESSPLREFNIYWQRFWEGPIPDNFPWSWSTLGEGDSALGVLVSPPEGDPKGVVVFFHGYLSHTGNFFPFLQDLRRQGWWIVATDLPAHGLSHGEIRGDVENFHQYGLMVEQVVGWIDSVVELKDLPKVGIGHSTGALALFEFDQTHQGTFSALVMGAPLIKSWLYGPTDFGVAVLGLFTSYISLEDSGDPLGVPYLPLHWFKALKEWNDQSKNYGSDSTPLLLITGGKDQVVETDYNISFLRDHFPHSQRVFFSGLEHRVFQINGYREAVWATVNNYIRQYQRQKSTQD